MLLQVSHCRDETLRSGVMTTETLLSLGLSEVHYCLLKTTVSTKSQKNEMEMERNYL